MDRWAQKIKGVSKQELRNTKKPVKTSNLLHLAQLFCFSLILTRGDVLDSLEQPKYRKPQQKGRTAKNQDYVCLEEFVAEEKKNGGNDHQLTNQKAKHVQISYKYIV